LTEENKINPFIAFLRLIRVENLLIIAATQYLFGYFVLNGLFAVPDQVLGGYYFSAGSTPPIRYGMQLSHLDFFLLSLSTVMIAAAGYIINDYFDVKTDRINRPFRIVIDKGIKRRVAMVAHTIINVIGIGLGFYIAYKVGNIKLGLIHLVTATLLWFYSTNFKKMFFIGNIIVAMMTGLVPITIALFEAQALKMNSVNLALIDEFYRNFINSVELNFNIGIYYAAVFGFFALLTNLTREIVKDMEDFIGDMETGGRTVPITLGINTTKVIVHLINAFTIVLLVVAAVKFWKPNADFVWYKLGVENSDKISALYLFVLLIIPLVVFSYRLSKSDTPGKYRKAGMFLKFVMLAGILYSFVIWYNYTKEII
jgi:4-hydroxybenzoate polyprenyltransferase